MLAQRLRRQVARSLGDRRCLPGHRGGEPASAACERGNLNRLANSGQAKSGEASAYDPSRRLFRRRAASTVRRPTVGMKWLKRQPGAAQSALEIALKALGLGVIVAPRKRSKEPSSTNKSAKPRRHLNPERRNIKKCSAKWQARSAWQAAGWRIRQPHSTQRAIDVWRRPRCCRHLY